MLISVWRGGLLSFCCRIAKSSCFRLPGKHIPSANCSSRSCLSTHSIYFSPQLITEKNVQILTLSAAETALATEDSDTQSEDDDVSVSEDSESEDELLLEFGDASNSDENDSKDSESEEEDELPEGARVNRYGRKVGNWRLRYSS